MVLYKGENMWAAEHYQGAGPTGVMAPPVMKELKKF